MMETSPPLNEAFRFLIVDDSRAIQDIIRRIVEACGYRAIVIVVAPNGEAALEILSDFNPHMLITDWHMPKMSGLELIQTVRQLGLTQTKVGLVTTETNPDMLEEARRNGALFVVNKPFKDQDLIAQMKAALSPDASPSALAATPVSPNANAPSASSPPSKANTGLVITNDCQLLIQPMMNGVPFRLIEQTPLASSALTAQNLIGLYSGKNKPIAAIAVMDMNAICIFGGGEHRLPPTVVREAMQKGTPNEAMVKQAGLFMQRAGSLLRIASENAPLPLSRTSLVPSSFPKLNEMLIKNGGRADYRISVPGYGDGCFSFLAV